MTTEPVRAEQPRISVLIPTHERRASVERAIRSLSTQTLPPDEYEIVVGVDGSTDGTRELLESIRAPCAVRHVWKPRGGRASACNAALRVATAPVVLFLDDDMEASRSLLSAHLDAHSGDSSVGVVGAVPIRTDATSPAVTRYVADRFNGHLTNLAAPGYQFGLRDFYSGNFSVSRRTMLDAGGYDESFTVYGNEDLDLSLRLRAAGVRLVFSATAVAYQHYEKNFAALARDTIEKGRTAVQLARKHPESMRDLKLSQFDRGPVGSRVVRNALLAADARSPAVRDRVVRAMTWLGDRHVRGLHRVYPAVLDYFYWLGARAAQAELEPMLTARTPAASAP
ncbi:MAG TPA: glycosyltransferase [Gemmatimonadaceae bacterium]|nr:glycosyltransferase [Gemmatimonadaceae bacterium]